MAPNQKGNRSSIRRKLLLPLFSFGFTISVLGLWSLTSRFNDQLMQKISQRAELLANVINYVAENTSHIGELRRLVSAIGADREVKSIILVGGTPTRVLASTQQAWLGRLLSDLPYQEVAEDLGKAIRTKSAHSYFNQEQHLLDHTIPLLLSDQDLDKGALSDGSVMVHLDTYPTEQEVRETLIKYSIAFLVALTICLSFVYWQLRRLVINPLNKIGDLAEKPYQVPDEWRNLIGDDEIGALAVVLRRTLSELKDIRQALDKHSIVSITDKQGKIIFANSKFCEISKYSWEEISGKDHRIINSGHHPKEFFQGLWRTISKGEIWQGDIQNRAKDGSIYWVQSTIVPFFDEKGKPCQYVSIRTDITEQKLQQSKLDEARLRAEAATYAKSQFLANMSHEIRTPLTSIIGFAEAAKEDGVSPTDRAKAFETIYRNGKHLLGVINDILDLSKIDAGAMQIEARSLSPAAVIENLRSVMVPRLAEKGLSLIVTYRSELPQTIISDQLRLTQVLINLISNALKFTESGHVEVSVWCDRTTERLHFSVTDTGVGLTQEQISRIFQPFSQAEVGTTRKYGGTGLGLSISKQLIDRLGGEISVQSSPNVGSTFAFSIKTGPLKDAAWISSITEAQNSVTSGEKTFQKLRGKVLIADDAEDNRRLIEFTLRKTDLDLTFVENGEEAVNKALTRQFDVILLDMQMPVMDGYTAAQEIRKSGINIPIVAFTANAMKNDILKCIEAGCTTHLPKPFGKEALFECLFQQIKNRRASEINNGVVISEKFKDDPEALGIVLDFVERLEERVSGLSKAIEQANFAKLEDLAHRLSGSAGLFGYHAMSDLGAMLEGCAKDSRLEEAKRLLDQVKSAYVEIQKGVPIMKAGKAGLPNAEHKLVF